MTSGAETPQPKLIPPVRRVREPVLGEDVADLNWYAREHGCHYIGVNDVKVIAEEPRPDGVFIMETDYGCFAIRKDFLQEYKRRFGYGSA